MNKEEEICSECGRSVAMSSRLFVNRVVDFIDYEQRLEMNKPFPEGAFICRECEEELHAKAIAGSKRIPN